MLFFFLLFFFSRRPSSSDDFTRWSSFPFRRKTRQGFPTLTIVFISSVGVCIRSCSIARKPMASDYLSSSYRSICVRAIFYNSTRNDLRSPLEIVSISLHFVIIHFLWQSASKIQASWIFEASNCLDPSQPQQPEKFELRRMISSLRYVSTTRRTLNFELWESIGCLEGKLREREGGNLEQ